MATHIPSETGERLEALAEILEERGFTATVLPGGKRPCIHVVNRAVTKLVERVYVAVDRDDSWWFWWSWAEPITPIADVATAATKIAQVLAPNGR